MQEFLPEMLPKLQLSLNKSITSHDYQLFMILLEDYLVYWPNQALVYFLYLPCTGLTCLNLFSLMKTYTSDSNNRAKLYNPPNYTANNGL